MCQAITFGSAPGLDSSHVFWADLSGSLRAALDRLQFPTTIALELVLWLWLTCCPTAVRALHCANGHHFNLLICPNLSERRLQRFRECVDRKQSIRQE